MKTANANSAPVQTLKMFEQEAFLNAATAASLQFKVFLAGPFIETTGKRPGKGEKNKAKRLRFAMFQRLTSIGWVVTMGEYKNLTHSSSSLFGDRNDSANAELFHAKNMTDAIVMIPSSPGSFLELGVFAMHADVCQKMIIIIDKIHENDEPNYLNTGPVPGAEKKDAKIHFIDYDDHESCWSVVNSFIASQSYRVNENRLLAP